MEKIVPKRRFSQNFLRDLNVVKDIVEAGNFFPADNVVEIGPGYGALTQLLIKKLHLRTQVLFQLYLHLKEIVFHTMV